MLLEPTYDRPNDALGRGHWRTEPWVIIPISVATVVFAIVVLTLLAVLRARARRAGEPPISSRGGSLPPPSHRPGP